MTGHDLFGATPEGEQVDRYVLDNGRLRVAVLTLGATVQRLEVADGTNVVLGLDSVDDYLNRSRYFGAVVGRYGNRIGHARFTLDGKEYRLAANDGAHSLHGGVRGFDKRVWRAEPAGPADLLLSLVSPDGEEGYPGELTASVRYLLDGDTLRLEYRATTDAPTVVNLTNHSYFNLAGGGDVRGHMVMLEAGHYLPVDEGKIPTGELAPVAGTPFDFTEPARVDARLGGRYDHCYVFTAPSDARPGAGSGVQGDGNPVLRGRATVTDPGSGRSLEVATSEPGVQFYTGHMLDGAATPFGPFAGLCLETQRFPDAPNRPAFPSAVLRPGATHVSATEYRFGVS
ncbi:aldose epimerase family protein [Actinomadura livida]|uniref:Aldose 1-epimerase n=1 Tax=Actinomadura livida TaxID=79909 RepID=A0A7W7IB97_9ACTN|nr:MULTISPECIES: aldose epimerase family protein [Actinomadura]MBB4773553.1 aldose 1-epimerase [Actinomadura catellatispora]GGU09112.1 aldose 1-epimerase [Actinomadura livida]